MKNFWRKFLNAWVKLFYGMGKYLYAVVKFIGETLYEIIESTVAAIKNFLEVVGTILVFLFLIFLLRRSLLGN